MFLPKFRDMRVKMPSPKENLMHFDFVTGRSVISNETYTKKNGDKDNE